MAGNIGESLPWPAQTVWANAVTDSERTGLLDKLKLPLETAAGKWWITEFEDASTPRLGTDEVYFERSMDRGSVTRTPILVTTRKTPWWAGPLLIILAVALVSAALMLFRRFMGGPEEAVKPERPPPIPGKPSAGPRDLEPRIDPRPWS